MRNNRRHIKHRDNAGFGNYPQGFEGAANRLKPSISRPVLKTLVLWRYRGRRRDYPATSARIGQQLT